MVSLEIEALLRVFLIIVVLIVVIPSYKTLSRYLIEWSKLEHFFQNLNKRISRLFRRLSRRVRGLQTGFLNNNLILYSLGMMMLFIAAFY
jgi:hypothetical protein